MPFDSERKTSAKYNRENRIYKKESKSLQIFTNI